MHIISTLLAQVPQPCNSTLLMQNYYLGNKVLKCIQVVIFPLFANRRSILFENIFNSGTTFIDPVLTFRTQGRI